MAIKYNGVDISKVILNGITVETVIYNGTVVLSAYNWRASDESYYNSAIVKYEVMHSSGSADYLPVPTAAGWAGRVKTGPKPTDPIYYYESYKVN